MKRLPIGLVLFIFVLTGCNLEVNKSIDISDGERIKKDLFTVNGSIRIGKDCQIEGNCRAVNGSIDIDDHSKVRDLNSINGGINLGEQVVVKGDVVTVNGPLHAKIGTVIQGEISAINGEIDLTGTEVKEDLVTLSGDVYLRDQTIIRGDIRVDKKGLINDSSNRLYLTIRVTDGSVVEGDVIVKDKEREVTLDLRRGGRVLGEIRNAEVLR